MLLGTTNNLEELRDSITFKTLKVVFSIYFLITLTVTAMHMYAEYKRAELSLFAQLKLFEDTFKPSLKDALWNFDNNAVNSAINGLLKNPAIIGVKIISTDNKEVIEEGVILDKNGRAVLRGDFREDLNKYVGTNLIIHRFPLNHIDTFDIMHILGEVELFSSKKIVLNEVKLGFTFIVVNALIKTIALWYLFLWAGTRFLSRPLGKFTANVQAIDMHNLNEIHVVAVEKRRNELNRLEDAFNTMTSNLRYAIVEQQKIKDALEISERYLQDVFNSMPSVLISINKDSVITHWNKAAEKLFGILYKDAYNKSIKEVMYVLKPQLQLIEEAIKHNKVQTKDKIKVTLDNEEHFLMLVVYPLELSKAGIVLRIDDISDRVLMENVLIQTEKMTSLGTLAAGMAHEINNPLSGILQGIQNIRRRFDPNLEKNRLCAEEKGIALDKLQDYMQERGIITFFEGVRELSERAALIVKNVLKFSRRSEGEMTKANINTMILDTISIIATDYSIKKQTSFKELEITKELDHNIPELYCSISEIEQVILNLVKNAAYALAEKPNNENPTITLRTKLVDYKVRIEVEDNGCGIDDRIKKRLFEPFFTTKPVGVGTGLGLSISYYIIADKHHGSLEVESELGVGTKFIITLPQLPAP